MKINKPGKPSSISPVGDSTTPPAARGKTSSTSSKQSTSGTNVTIGSTASQLNSLESSMMSTPIVDAKKVAEIKQALSEGRFKVNSEVVAEGLIKTVRDLIDDRK